MTLPMGSNTTCDVFRVNNNTTTPNVAGVSVYLVPRFSAGGTHAFQSALEYSHVLYCDATIDIRDGYSGGTIGLTADNVWVPSYNAGKGTKFTVVFVERIGRGTGVDHKRVYVQRLSPAWPTNDL
jgi:hypothetical protein